MNAQPQTHSAINVPTRFVETNGRKLAYRMYGEGPALLLCLRFRGVMDSWDPAFLDSLAQNFTVVTFDYSGLGQSSGEPSYDRRHMARDAKDLVDALDLGQVVIGGWSIGGAAAQVFATLYPENTSHLILIGTTPPGPQPHSAEAVFLPTAMKAVNTLEDEFILFFEPHSEASRAAATASHERIALRTKDTSTPVSETVFLKLLKETRNETAVFVDDGGYADYLKSGVCPILMISGDHDVVFPVENWYALTREWKSLNMLVLPQAGHGPQHQYPEPAADAVTSFVRNN